MTKTPAPSLALVGAGYWGRNLARNFHAIGALRMLCDPSPTTLDNYGADYSSVRKVSNVDQALADIGVTEIAIAAPATAHYRIARAAIEAGKDVYVEKPLCLDETEALQLVDLAEQRGRILMVGHLLQYHPCVQKLQDMINAGELGKLCYLTSNRLNLGKIRKEENALWSFAPHDISVILSMAGKRLPEEVRCIGDSYLTDGVSDTTLTTMRFGGRLRAHIYVSWLNPFKEQKLTVVGSEGMVVFDDTRPWAEKLIVFRRYLTWAEGQNPIPSKASSEAVIVPEAEPLRAECEHFVTCCRERKPPRTDGREGLRVLQVLQAAQKSLEGGGDAVCIESTGRYSVSTSDELSAGEGGTPGIQPDAEFQAHQTAIIDSPCEIGKGTKIWHFAHVSANAKIGEKCILGQNTFVAGGVVIGNNVKVQNNVAIYTGTIVHDDVFLGPSCVLTNVTNPRSQIVRHTLYEQTVIHRGATVGANATIVCGVELGRYCFVAAGAVVTKSVPDYALVAGNPARHKGWMSRHGHVLRNPDVDGKMRCPESGLRYQVVAVEEPADAASGSAEDPTRKRLRCVDLDEDAPLPSNLSQGALSYRALRQQGG